MLIVYNGKVILILSWCTIAWFLQATVRLWPEPERCICRYK